jgi:paraquat-inducible protein A
MTRRNLAALALTLVSLGLLWPGLTEPVLTITASVTVLGQTREVFRQTQSIWQSVRTLHESGNTFVALLILFFSITVPVIKAGLLAAVLAAGRHATKRRLFLFVRSVSKWAMADVFVVGVFIAYLAAKATDNLDAVAERGFYFFAAYCLLSNLSFQVLNVTEESTT